MITRLEPRLEAKRHRLSDFVPAFLDHARLVQQFTPATLRAYADALAMFLEFCAESDIDEPGDVKPRTVEAFLVWLQQRRGVGVNTTLHRRSVLSAFWKFLLREEVATTNPAAAAHAPRKPKRIPEFLTPTEVNEVLRVLGERRGLWHAQTFVIIAFFALAGVRVSELVQLRAERLDLERGVCHVVQGKGRKDRMIPIIGWLADVLRGYLAHVRPLLPAGDCLFVTRRGRSIGARNLWTRVHHAVSPIVGRAVHPHALRHSFASRAAFNGVSAAVLQASLGHADPRTTAIYTHLPDRQAVALMSKALTGRDDAVHEEEVRAALELPAVDVLALAGLTALLTPEDEGTAEEWQTVSIPPKEGRPPKARRGPKRLPHTFKDRETRRRLTELRQAPRYRGSFRIPRRFIERHVEGESHTGGVTPP